MCVSERCVGGKSSYYLLHDCPLPEVVELLSSRRIGFHKCNLPRSNLLHSISSPLHSISNPIHSFSNPLNGISIPWNLESMTKNLKHIRYCNNPDNALFARYNSCSFLMMLGKHYSTNVANLSFVLNSETSDFLKGS